MPTCIGCLYRTLVNNKILGRNEEKPLSNYERIESFIACIVFHLLLYLLFSHQVKLLINLTLIFFFLIINSQNCLFFIKIHFNSFQPNKSLDLTTRNFSRDGKMHIYILRLVQNQRDCGDSSRSVCKTNNVQHNWLQITETD